MNFADAKLSGAVYWLRWSDLLCAIFKSLRDVF